MTPVEYLVSELKRSKGVLNPYYYEAYKVDEIIQKAKQMEIDANKPKKYTPESDVASDGVVTVDLSTFDVTYNGQTKKLAKKVVYLIHYFITHKGKVIPRDKIVDDVWGPDVIVVKTTVDVHITRIKAALFDGCITTIKGAGFKWVA